MQIEIMDLDRSTYPKSFLVEYATESSTGTTLISYAEFGDYLVSAGEADGFDGERLIWFGDPDFRFDYATGQIRETAGRARTQPIEEYVRMDMGDETVAGYVSYITAGQTA